MLKKVLSIILSASCLLATASSLSVSADETIGDSNTNAQVFVLNEENNGQPPIYYGDNDVVPYSNTPPSSSSVYYLSAGAYNGWIEEFTARVFTNVMFTRATQIQVILGGGVDMQHYLSNYVGAKVSIVLYNENGKVIQTETSVSPTTQITRYFYNLDRNSKYYFAVVKTYDGVTLNDVSLTITNWE
ncbi:MAG: hypothetical protein UDO63_04145 [Oscillospiraceae bacterium]